MKRRVVLILVIVGVVGLLAGGLAWYLRRSSGVRLLARAELALQAGNTDRAMELSNDYIRKYPADWRGYYTKAQALMRIGRYEEARQMLDQAGRLDPTTVLVPLALSDTYALPARQALANASGAGQVKALQSAIEQINQANQVLLPLSPAKSGDALQVSERRGTNYFYLFAMQQALAGRLEEDIKLAEVARNQDAVKEMRGGLEKAKAEQDKAGRQAAELLLDVVQKDPSRTVAADTLVDLCTSRNDPQLWEAARRAVMSAKDPPPTAAAKLAIQDLSVTKAKDISAGTWREAMNKTALFLDGLIAGHPQLPEPKVHRAYVALELGDYDTASRLCQEVLKDSPRHERARLTQAKALLSQGKPAEAERLLFAIKTEYATWPEAHYVYSQAALITGKRELAREALRTVTRLDPKSNYPEARRRLAEMLLEEGFGDQAFADAEAYYQAHPDEPAAIEVFVQSAQRSNRAAAALAELEKIRAANSSSPVVQMAVSGGYYIAAAALAELEKLRASPAVLMAVSGGYGILGDKAKATDAARQAAECKPIGTNALLAVARAKRELGRVPEAEKMLSDELRQDPVQAARLHAELGQVYQSTARVLQAIEEYRAALKLDSGNVQYRLWLARALLNNEEHDDCIRELDKVDRTNAEANLLRLQARLAMGQQVDPDPALQESLGKERGGLMLAQIYLTNGKPQECAKLCQDNLERTTNDADLRFLLGQAFLAMGDKDKCLAEWMRVVQRQPAELRAYLRVGEVLAGDKTPDEVEKALADIPGARRDQVDLAMGALLVRLGKHAAAAQAYDRLASRGGTAEGIRSQARLLRARALAAGNDIDGALAELDKLPDDRTWRTLALGMKAELLVLAGRQDKALPVLEDLRTQAAQATDGEALRRVAGLYARLQQFDQALAVCDDLRRMFPNEPSCYLLRAEILATAGKREEIPPLLEKAVDLQPGNLGLYVDLARAYDDQSQPRRVLETLKRAEALGPAGLLTAMDERGATFIRWGLHAQAIECFQELAKQGQAGNPRLHMFLGQAFARLGQKGKAVEQLQGIPSYASSYVPAQLLLADLADGVEAKMRILSALNEAKPDQPRVLDRMMAILMDANRPAEAVKMYITSTSRPGGQALPPQTVWMAFQAALAAKDMSVATDLCAKVANQTRAPGWRQLAALLAMNDKPQAAAELLPSNDPDMRSAAVQLLLALRNKDRVAAQRCADRIDQIEQQVLKPPASRRVVAPYGLLANLATERPDQAKANLARLTASGSVLPEAFAELVAAAGSGTVSSDDCARLLKAFLANDLGAAALGRAWALEVLRSQPTCRLAAALAIQGASDKATYETVLAMVRPGDGAFAQNLRGSMLMEEKKFLEAAAVFASGAAADKGNLRLVMMQAIALEKAGRLEEALGLYRAVWQGMQDLAAANNAAYLICQLYPKDQARLAEAQQLCDAAVQVAGEPAFFDTRGWVAHLRGQKDRALADVRRAIVGIPGSPEAHYHLGVLEAEAGDDEMARWHLKAAVDIAEVAKAAGELGVAEASAARLAAEALAKLGPAGKPSP